MRQPPPPAASVAENGEKHLALLGTSALPSLPKLCYSKARAMCMWSAELEMVAAAWGTWDHQWQRKKPLTALLERKTSEKPSAWHSTCARHLSVRNTTSARIIVMKHCKQEQGLVTCSSLIHICFYRCAVHGNEMISSSKHLSRGETNQLFANASKWQDLSDTGCGESLWVLFLDLL